MPLARSHATTLLQYRPVRSVFSPSHRSMEMTGLSHSKVCFREAVARSQATAFLLSRPVMVSSRRCTAAADHCAVTVEGPACVAGRGGGLTPLRLEGARSVLVRGEFPRGELTGRAHTGWLYAPEEFY